MGIKVSTVEAKCELGKFIDFPWFIYRKYRFDKNWTPPLKRDMKFKLNTEKHPFWKHAELKLFLAYRDDLLVGRIGAIIDYNYNKLWDEKMGAFGFFECINDQQVANALFDNAGKWLKEKGMRFVRGPLSPSMNDECAFLIDGFDKPPVVMMPYNLEYYPEAAGIGITIPDYNQVLAHLDGKLGPVQIAKAMSLRKKITGIRAMVFGFKPQFRRTGLPILLYWETEQAGQKLGYKWCELSWNLEDNDLINKFDTEIGGKIYKRYKIYEREL